MIVFLCPDLAPGGAAGNAPSYIFIFDLSHRATVTHVIAGADNVPRDSVDILRHIGRLVGIVSLGAIIVIYPS